MALQPTQRWLDAARAGTAEPVMLVELRPTVLYDEKNFAGDWRAGRDSGGRSLADPANISNLNTATAGETVEPYPDELRLARREVEHPEAQPLSLPMGNGVTFRHFGQYEKSGVNTYAEAGQYIQTFRCSRAFRLKKLKLGLYNHGANYKGRLRVKLYSHLSESALSGMAWSTATRPFGVAAGPAARGIYDSAVLAHSFEFNAARDSLSGADPAKTVEGVDFESVSGNTFRIFDLAEANVWLPGGDIPCAIDLCVDRDDNARDLHLYGATDDNAYSRGQLLHHDHGTGKSFKLPGDMGFKFVAEGYAETGTGVWTLDLGKKPGHGLEGELELRYAEPPGTTVRFELRESDSASGWPDAWRVVSDGARLEHRRFVQVRVTLSSAGAHGLDTPRIYSIRAAYKQAFRFVLASRPLFGCPNLVAEVPDYSAEGDPLAGRAGVSDTSRLVLLNAEGMLPRLFSLYDLKNDEVRVCLGFDTPGFLDTSGREYNEGRGDWLQFKTLRIEDWELGEAALTIHGYDQQVRFLEAEAPTPGRENGEIEQIHYHRLPPAIIKRDLLMRAGIRPSQIDFVPGGDGLPRPENSFGALGAAASWQLSRVIGKPTRLHSVDQELNRHLAAFQVTDERGRWVLRRADFEAGAAALLSGDDILAGSERYHPGHRHLRNLVALYFGGEGSDESAFRALALDVDEESGKRCKEFVVDKLLSEFIPLSDDSRDPAGIPFQVARARLRLQRHGLRTLEFSTRLEHARLQIGDHIHVESARYRRAGTAAPNPLLVMLTRKSVNRSLSRIDWSALVLADSEEVGPGSLFPSPPAGISVSPNGDGTVTWLWQAGPDDDGVRLLRYELYRRRAHTDGWGFPVVAVSATGAGQYSWDDGPYDELMRYDFAVRAVDTAGRYSAAAVAWNVDVTAEPPTPPGPEDWELEPREGAIALWLVNESPGAHHYRVHVLLGGTGWRSAGKVECGTGRENAFLYFPDDPTSLFTIRVFALSAVDSYSQEGEWSGYKVQMFRRLMSSTEVPPAPAWESAGGVYPLVSHVPVGPYQGFTVHLRLLAPGGFEDRVSRYEIQRANDGGSGLDSWSDWERLPDCPVLDPSGDEPGPSALIYENRDPSFKTGRRYRYRARGVGRNNVPGLWSETLVLLLTEDTTAPDRPLVSLVARTGYNELSISEPTIAGGPCPDFDYWKIEGFKQESGQWEVLEPQWRDTRYGHGDADGEMEKPWKYRVTAFDHSGNASPPSLETGFGSMKKAGTTFLSSAVNGTLAQVSVNQAEIELKVSKSGVISAINLSSEGVNIAGDRITLDGDTVFSADCEIHGELKMTRTSGNLERIEIGSFSTGEEIRCYGSLGGSVEHLGIRICTHEFGINNLPVIQLSSNDMLGWGVEPGWFISGLFIQPAGYAAFILPDAAYSGSWPAGEPCIGWDVSTGRIRAGDRGNRTFIPREQDYDLAAGRVYRINGTQVLGAPQDAVADAGYSGVPAALSECARASDFNVLVDRFNSLLGRLRNHGMIST